MQFDLLRLAMNDASLAKLWKPDGEAYGTNYQMWFTEAVYMLQVFRYLQYSYVVGNLTKATLTSALVNDVLRNRRFRERWRQLDQVWSGEAVTVGEIEFAQIVRESIEQVELLGE